MSAAPPFSSTHSISSARECSSSKTQLGAAGHLEAVALDDEAQPQAAGRSRLAIASSRSYFSRITPQE